MEIWWVCLKCPCMCSYSQGMGGWETTTSAASQMCNCHLGTSSAFRGEDKWLQWATAEGDVAWHFLTFPWNEMEAFPQATLKYLLEGKSWWVVKSHFQNHLSAVSLWTGQLSCSACACMAGMAGLLLAFQTCCIFLWQVDPSQQIRTHTAPYSLSHPHASETGEENRKNNSEKTQGSG